MKGCGYVYVIESLKNGRFYIGSTNNLERRVHEHNTGKSKYTSESGPWKLVFNQKYNNILMARRVELWLKKQKDADFVRKIIGEKIITKNFC